MKPTFSDLQRKKVLIRWKQEEVLLFEKTIKDVNKRNFLKSSIIGFLQGDGFVAIRREKTGIVHYDLAFYPDDFYVACLFVYRYELLFGKELKIRFDKNFYKIRTSQKSAVFDLLASAKFRSLEWRIPEYIADKDVEKREWIRALFDCEAYVGKREVTMQSVSKDGLLDVQKTLLHFGIFSKMYSYQRKEKNWNTNFILRIGKKENIRNFLKEIGFNHSKKKIKLKTIAGVA